MCRRVLGANSLDPQLLCSPRFQPSRIPGPGPHTCLLWTGPQPSQNPPWGAAGRAVLPNQKGQLRASAHGAPRPGHPSQMATGLMSLLLCPDAISSEGTSVSDRGTRCCPRGPPSVLPVVRLHTSWLPGVLQAPGQFSSRMQYGLSSALFLPHQELCLDRTGRPQLLHERSGPDGPGHWLREAKTPAQDHTAPRLRSPT